MRGADERTAGLFSYVRLEDRIAADHPLRAIRLSIGVQSGPPIGAQKGPPWGAGGRLMLGAGFALLAA